MPVFNDFDARTNWIAEEWKRQADDLAVWAMEHLVNRRDVWGQYTLSNGEVGVFTLPVKARRESGSDMVTLDKLRRHFSGRVVSHLIGLHSVSNHETCKWFAIDVDLHDESVVNSDEIALANLAACLAWSKRLRENYMDPCLIDTNGVGGFHLLVMLDREYPLADVFEFVSDLRSDYQKFGLTKKPEIFPSKPEMPGEKLGNWLRLPGRHHSRPHFSRIWNFEADGKWLEGGDAVEAILSLRSSALPAAAGVNNLAATKKAGFARSGVGNSSRRARVCVDLDRVLAKYDGWKGRRRDDIGPPIPGALEFMKTLARVADIVIFTSRCSLDTGGGEPLRVSPGQLKIAVVDWLERHKLPFTDVYIGHGKPRASAFIDDRAVNCDPQSNPDAYRQALENLSSLLRLKSLISGENMSEDKFEQLSDEDLKVSLGSEHIVHIPARELKRMAGEIRKYYLSQTGDDYPLHLILEAMLRWVGSHVEMINDDMEELFLEPHRKEAFELRLILEELAHGQTASLILAEQTSAREEMAAISATADRQLNVANIFNGFREHSGEKINAMIAYIAENGRRVFKTKLNKLLFYSDFINFYLHGRSISGSQYVHLPFGPVPDGYDTTLKQMTGEQFIEIKKVKVPTGEAEMIRAGKKQIGDALSAEEIATLDWVLANYGVLNSAQISDLSHDEMAYKYTLPNEKIAYGYAQFLKKLPGKVDSGGN